MEVYAFYKDKNDVELEVYPIVGWDRHSTNKYHQVVGGLPIIPLDKSHRMNDSNLVKYYIRYGDDVYCPQERDIRLSYDEMRQDVLERIKYNDSVINIDSDSDYSR